MNDTIKGAIWIVVVVRVVVVTHHRRAWVPIPQYFNVQSFHRVRIPPCESTDAKHLLPVSAPSRCDSTVL